MKHPSTQSNVEMCKYSIKVLRRIADFYYGSFSRQLIVSAERHFPQNKKKRRKKKCEQFISKFSFRTQRAFLCRRSSKARSFARSVAGSFLTDSRKIISVWCAREFQFCTSLVRGFSFHHWGLIFRTLLKKNGFCRRKGPPVCGSSIFAESVYEVLPAFYWFPFWQNDQTHTYVITLNYLKRVVLWLKLY